MSQAEPAADLSQAQVATAIYGMLLTLGDLAQAAENAAVQHSALWGALGKSLDAAAALAGALRDLEG